MAVVSGGKPFASDPQMSKGKSVIEQASQLLEQELETASNHLEDVSSSITQTWTDQAVKCFVTNGDCNNCVIPKGNYSFECQMKNVVPVLVKNVGAPDVRRINKLMPYLHQ